MRKTYIKDSKVIKKLEKEAENSNVPTAELLKLAEQVHFNDLPSQIIATDQYGFEARKTILNQQYQFTQEEIINQNRELEEWQGILSTLSSKNLNHGSKDFDKLKKKFRNGIPDSLRAVFWQQLAETNKYYQEGLFDYLVKLKPEKEEEYDDSEQTILKDLSRTVPNHSFFSQNYGEGQRAMFNVLSAYSKFNKETNYVQGMSFIVALLLIYMEQENAFYCFHSIMVKYGMIYLFKPGFPGLKPCFYVLFSLIKKFLPKIFKIFKENNINASLFSAEWFLTLFSRDMNYTALVRIFDTFFIEGFKVIYRFCLGIIKLNEKEIIESKEEPADTLRILKEACSKIDNIDQLMKFSFSFSFSRKHNEIINLL